MRTSPVFESANALINVEYSKLSTSHGSRYLQFGYHRKLLLMVSHQFIHFEVYSFKVFTYNAFFNIPICINELCEKYIVHLNIQYELHNYQFRSPLISVTYDFKSLCINYCMMFPLKKFTGIVLGGEKMPYSLTVSINSGNYFSSLRLLITTYLFFYLWTVMKKWNNCHV